MSADDSVAAERLLAADARMTAERVETKYLVPLERLGRLTRVLGTQLLVHRPGVERARGGVEAGYFVSSVYVDTTSLVHYRAARADSERNVKLRAKEYYDLDPAESGPPLVREQPWLWLELKRRSRERTRKHRLRLQRAEVPAFLEGGVLPWGAYAEDGAARADALARIAKHRRKIGEKLAALCVVNYRRLSWQDAERTLRVTVDLELGYYASPRDVWTRASALVRGTFGAALGTESCAVVEIKRRRPQPVWLARAIAELDVAPSQFSKFLAAGAAVAAERAQEPAGSIPA